MRGITRAVWLLAWLMMPAPAHASPGELEFVLPDGFVEIARRGALSASAPQLPELVALAGSPSVELVAAKTKEGKTVESTFQVMYVNRPVTFDAASLDDFATQVAAQMGQGGLKSEIRHKDTVTLAGRTSARVALLSPGRRMLFYGIPDGRRTAVLLYAASETDFPDLFPAFERSAQATRVKGALAPSPAAPTPSPSRSLPWWILVIGLMTGAGLVAVLARRGPKRPARKKPAKRR